MVAYLFLCLMYLYGMNYIDTDRREVLFRGNGVIIVGKLNFSYFDIFNG